MFYYASQFLVASARIMLYVYGRRCRCCSTISGFNGSNNCQEIKSNTSNFNLQIESHIFNFNEQVYGKSITIEFLTRIRDEKKFETVEKLIENIKMDVIFAEKYFKDLKI